MKKILILCLLLSSVALGQQAPRTSFPSQNFIINGDATFNQRGNITSIASGSYFVDRFVYVKSGSMVHNASQSSDVPTVSQSGHASSSSIALALTTPDTSIASGEYVGIIHKIEGTNYAQFAGKTFTLSFWVKATATGTYSVSFRNGANTVSYVANYNINSTETWEKKTITVPAPTIGAWSYDNTSGLEVVWALAIGSTYQTSTLNTWQSSLYLASTSQTNGVNTSATNFKLAQVMLNSGPTAAPFALAGGDVAGELAKVQRYYQRSGESATSNPCSSASIASSASGNANRHYIGVTFGVQMRAIPTIYTCSDATSASGGTTGDGSYSYTIDSFNNYSNGTVSSKATNGFVLMCSTGSVTYQCRAGYRADAEL